MAKNSVSEQGETTAIAQARAQFGEEEIPFPPIPDTLRPLVQQIEPWCFGTRQDTPALNAIDWFVEESGTASPSDYLLFGHAGHGMASYAIDYYLVYRPVSLFVQIAWGGAYVNLQRAATEMARIYSQIELILQTAGDVRAAGLYTPEERWIAVASLARPPLWTYIPASQPREVFLHRANWHEAEDPFFVVRQLLADRLSTGSHT